MGGEFLGSPIPNTLIYITHLLWIFFYTIIFSFILFILFFIYQKLHSILFLVRMNVVILWFIFYFPRFLN